jgi:hypothetical protein
MASFGSPHEMEEEVRDLENSLSVLTNQLFDCGGKASFGSFREMEEKVRKLKLNKMSVKIRITDNFKKKRGREYSVNFMHFYPTNKPRNSARDGFILDVIHEALFTPGQKKDGSTLFFNNLDTLHQDGNRMGTFPHIRVRSLCEAQQLVMDALEHIFCLLGVSEVVDDDGSICGALSIVYDSEEMRKREKSEAGDGDVTAHKRARV